MSTNEETPLGGNREASTTRTGDSRMLVMREGQVQASVTRMHYSGGVTSATILCVSDDAAWQVPVTISGLPQRAAAGYVGALARLMAGAVVMDGADVLAIRDALDGARRVA